MSIRLHKYLADAGIASRRASEQIILDGQVQVNGRIVRELGTKVDPAQDHVTVQGRKIEPRRKFYLALNKPPGYVCTRKDPQGRRTLQDLLPKEWNFLYSIGRLDMDSDGLILLTNDGDFCQRVTHPRYAVLKKYHATIEGQVDSQMLSQMKHRIKHEGELLRAQKARLLESYRSHSLVELELAEGKNREVRRLFEALGLRVSRLHRFQIGKIRLGELPKGKWRTLTKSEIKSLLPES